MSFPTPHSGYLLLLAGLAFFLFACAMLIQQPARFVYIPATPVSQVYPVNVSYMTPELNDIRVTTIKKTESFINNGISPPECHEITRQRWVCSGFIENPLNFPVYQPSIRLNVYENNQFNAHKIILSANRVVLPGEITPYHLYIDGQAVHTTINTILYEKSDSSQQQPVRLRTIILDNAWLDNGEGHPVYEVHIQIHNPYQLMLKSVRIVISLFDEDETITAYRVFNLENLAANATETHTFRLIAWINEKDVDPHILAEGLAHP